MPLLLIKAQNPVLLKDVRAGSSGSAITEILPTVAGSTFFTADDNGRGDKGLWSTDGTAGGTVKLKLAYPGYSTYNASMLTAFGTNKVFFAGDNIVGYGEVWTSNGTQAGTTPIERYEPKNSITIPPVMGAVSYKENVVYAVYTNNNHIQLKTTAGSNTLIHDFGGGKIYSRIDLMQSVGSHVLFTYRESDLVGSSSIWASDGTVAYQVANLGALPGSPSTYAVTSSFIPAGNSIYFVAANNKGSSLFQFDISSPPNAQVTQVKFLGNSVVLNKEFAVIGSSIYFVADDNVHGKELWKSNGRADGTSMVADVNPGIAASNPGNLTVMNNKLYFTATGDIDKDGQANETVLYSYNGAILTPVYQLSPNSSNVSGIAVCNNTLLFSLYNATGSEIWVSDGVNAHMQLADINPGSASSSPTLFKTVGNAVYFKANDGTHGQELFKYTAPDKIFTGAKGNSWAENGNWMPAGVPLAKDDILIGYGQAAAVRGTILCNSLTVNGMLVPTTGLVMDNAEIVVNADAYNAGSINVGAAGKLTIAYNKGHPNHLFGCPGSFIGNVVTELNTKISLIDNVAIDGTLHFETPGTHMLYLNDYDLSVNAVEGASATAYVITNGGGSLTLNNIAYKQTLFPIGISNTSYTPLSITNAGIVDNFSARVAPGVLSKGIAGDTIRNQCVNRTWFLQEGKAGGSNVTVTTQWNVADELPLFKRVSSYLHHYTNNLWDAGSPGASSGTGPFTLSRSGFTSFSPFVVSSSSNILPVTLTNFSVYKQKTNAMLSWVTASESNSSHFNIQRSLDGITYQVIATIDAAGNSNNRSTYNFTDNISNLNTIIHYRLQQVDKNGKINLSQVRVLNNVAQVLFSVSPNPARGVITVAGNARIVQIYNMLGKLLSTYPVSSGVVGTRINVSALPKGIYVVVAYNAAGDRDAQRLVIE